MRTTIAATATALALLAGCGGGDSDTALTPGDSASPTASAAAEATASASASSPAKAGTTPTKMASSGPKGDPYFHPGVASGDHLPLTGELLRGHEAGTPYPAAQLEPKFTGEAIVKCENFEFPLDRLLNPRYARDLSPTAKKYFNGYLDTTGKNGIVAIADERHVVLLERYPNSPESFDFAEAFYEVKADGKYRWWVDLDYPPSSCTITRVLPDLEQVYWKRAVRPKPGDRSIQVSFNDSYCNEKAALDRVKVAILGVAADGIRIALGQTKVTEKPVPVGPCKEAKKVIMTIPLPEPIGDRPVLQAGVYPEARADADYPTCDELPNGCPEQEARLE